MCLSKNKKFKIMERDDYTCYYCGSINSVIMTVDHLTPISRGGGKDNDDNLVCSCSICNYLKADKTPEEFLEYMAVLDSARRKGMLLVTSSRPNLKLLHGNGIHTNIKTIHKSNKTTTKSFVL